jgi:3-deoxy-D-manno-octulosonic-acid transferase
MPLLLTLYKAATTLAAPLMPWWLQRRIARAKEDSSRWRERFGETNAPKPARPTIWLHAASVGETNSILPLLNDLAARGHHLVLTTGTATSEQLVRGKLPSNVVHQFAPLDHGPWVERFLDHWTPKLALRVDSELWPNTILALAARDIPIVQVNARLSAKAANNWAKISPDVLFSKFALVLAQSDDDRARYAALGAPNTAMRGNLKLDQPDLAHDPRALDDLKAQIGDRPVWLAASIHPGEDLIVGAAQRAMPNALLIVVPRHTDRGAEMSEALRTQGLGVARRSKGEAITSGTQVYMADTMGELGLFYRVCRVVFMGKSFTVGGGQNPAEAAQLGCALLWGPDMSNFTEIARDLTARGAALEVRQPERLGEAIGNLLSDPARAGVMGDTGRAFVRESHGTLARVLADLAPYLDRVTLG